MNDYVKDCRVEGSILLDGQDIYADFNTTLLRQRVGMVFQHPNPFPMSIYDNVSTTTLPTACAAWVSRTARSSMASWRSRCVAPPCGMR